MPPQEHICNKESDIEEIKDDVKDLRKDVGELSANIVTLTTQFSAVHKKLVGNGQIGLIDDWNQNKPAILKIPEIIQCHY